ncbi:MAG TPA: hypothetical protein VEK57_14485 [Thermoanaerobaculia bacterium]|nr:hypothetical protein [Thermoanaerobaculia bacterium]
MNTAPAEALVADVRPSLIVRIPPDELERLFPVPFVDLDPLAAAEPSRGALLRLASGRMVVIEYGLVTSRLTVSVPTQANIAETLVDLLREAQIDMDAVVWITDEIEVPAANVGTEGAEIHVLELWRTLQKKHRSASGENTHRS